MNNLNIILENLIGEKYRNRVDNFILHGKNLIMVKTQEGHIIPPGGGIESGETFKDAAYRESLEEGGIEVKNIQLLKYPECKRKWMGKTREYMLKKNNDCDYIGDKTRYTISKFNKLISSKGKEQYFKSPIIVPISEYVKYLLYQLENDIPEYRDRHLYNLYVIQFILKMLKDRINAGLGLF